MKSPQKIAIALIVTTILIAGILAIIHFRGKRDGNDKISLKPGEVVATYRQVDIYSNGRDYTVSHGKHYSKEGYYYGQKWQCVEFVKRFYHDALGHHMPSVWGHAKDFYDPSIPHGSLNPERGMIQFQNGGKMKPRPDDLLVFGSSGFGHVAVISAVSDDEVEVVQQNIAGRPRQKHSLSKRDDHFFIGKDRQPIGWLRLPVNP